MTRERVIGGLLLLAAAFPYIQMLPLVGASYTQPFPLLVGVISLMAIPGQLATLPVRDRYALVTLAGLGVALFVLTCVPYTRSQEYKYLLSYVSPLVLTVGLVTFARTEGELAKRLLAGAIVTWVAVALVQRLYNPSFGTWVLGQWGKSAADIVDSGRGVLGFAPEPTHHAFHILILGAALAVLDRTGRYVWAVGLAVADAVVLAGSSSAVLVLALAALVLGVWRRPLVGLIGAAIVRFGWPYAPAALAFTMGRESRAYKLFDDLLLDPSSWLTVDFSVNIRLGGVWAVAVDIWHHWFWPRGLDWMHWMATRRDALRDIPWLADLSEVGPPSGLGVLVYQAGFLVVPVLWFMFLRILRVQPRNLLYQVVLISMPFTFLGQYYLSAPSFSVLYAGAIAVALAKANEAKEDGEANVANEVSEAHDAQAQ